jgi:predicted patatin/cPLA2 family phospholipase
VADLFGKSPENVLSVLLARKAASYVPNSSVDGNRIALIFEGGAMAGLYSSAAGTALEQLGLTNCFDLVYGTSAGAINAAYFVAGQSADCTLAYENEVISKEFMGAFRWPNQIDVNWLADNLVLKGPRMLHIDRLRKTSLHLQVSATDTESGNCRFFSSKKDPIELMISAIKASGSTPHFTINREHIQGQTYNDGVLRAPIATLRAIEDGANMFVVLLTRPKGRVKKFNFLRSLTEYLLRIRFYNWRYQNVFFARNAFYADAIDAIHSIKLTSSAALSPTSTPLRSLEKRKALIAAESIKYVKEITNIMLVKARHK